MLSTHSENELPSSCKSQPEETLQIGWPSAHVERYFEKSFLSEMYSRCCSFASVRFLTHHRVSPTLCSLWCLVDNRYQTSDSTWVVTPTWRTLSEGRYQHMSMSWWEMEKIQFNYSLIMSISAGYWLGNTTCVVVLHLRRVNGDDGKDLWA